MNNCWPGRIISDILFVLHAFAVQVLNRDIGFLEVWRHFVQPLQDAHIHNFERVWLLLLVLKLQFLKLRSSNQSLTWSSTISTPCDAVISSRTTRSSAVLSFFVSPELVSSWVYIRHWDPADVLSHPFLPCLLAMSSCLHTQGKRILNAEPSHSLTASCAGNFL